MNILISNDDGVNAPGIVALAKTIETIANITVIAPDRNRSGASNSLTLTNPLRVMSLENGYYSVEGTPTDCVHLAATGFFDKKFDMVLSGINRGSNLGDDVLYSGTVAAAIEARFLGIPSLAISLVGESNHNFIDAAKIVKNLVLQLQHTLLPTETILNINIPNINLADIKGVEITRLGKRHCAEKVIADKDPRGRPIYWIGPPGNAADAGMGTDFDAINRSYISITPIHIDMTNYNIFNKLSNLTHIITE